MENTQKSIPKTLIRAVIILFLSILCSWLYALSGGFQKIVYILGCITIAFWVCLYMLVYKLSKNKTFSYIIWFYFISMATLAIFMLFDFNIPRLLGWYFFIFFVSVWAPIAYTPEFIMRLINKDNVFVTNNLVLCLSVSMILAVFIIVYFTSRFIKKHKQKDDENKKTEES